MDNKVLLKEETVVSIADAIREKSGSSEKMTPAQMAVRIQNLTVGGSEDLIDDLNAIHGEEAKSTAEEAITTIEENVDEQAGLIEQISAALEGKSVGGGSGIDTCTVIFRTRDGTEAAMSIVATCYIDEEFVAYADIFTPALGEHNKAEIIINNVVCGSAAYVCSNYNHYSVPAFNYTGCEYIDFRTTQDVAIKITAGKNETAVIEIYDADD